MNSIDEYIIAEKLLSSAILMRMSKEAEIFDTSSPTAAKDPTSVFLQSCSRCHQQKCSLNRVTPFHHRHFPRNRHSFLSHRLGLNLHSCRRKFPKFQKLLFQLTPLQQSPCLLLLQQSLFLLPLLHLRLLHRWQHHHLPL